MSSPNVIVFIKQNPVCLITLARFSTMDLLVKRSTISYEKPSLFLVYPKLTSKRKHLTVVKGVKSGKKDGSEEIRIFFAASEVVVERSLYFEKIIQL